MADDTRTRRRREEVQARIDAVMKLEAMDRKAWKRGYMRKYMQTHRDRDKHEVDVLRAQVRQLDADLRHATDAASKAGGISMLSWKDVSAALLQCRLDSTSDNAELKRHSHEVTAMAHDLSRWISAWHRRSVVPPSLPLPRWTWRNVALPSAPLARTAAKEWIAQHMLHNADHIFREYGLPSRDSPVAMEDLDIAMSDECWHLEYRLHQVVAHPIDMEIAKHGEFHRRSACNRLGVDAVAPVPLNTCVETTSTTALHQMRTSQGELINLLCGEFIEPDRAVFVIQQIHDDDARPATASDRMRDRMAWQEFCRQPNGDWVQRRVYRMSQSFTSRGVVPLADEARLWGLDLTGIPTVNGQEVHFRHRALAMAKVAYNM